MILVAPQRKAAMPEENPPNIDRATLGRVMISCHIVFPAGTDS